MRLGHQASTGLLQAMPRPYAGYKITCMAVDYATSTNQLDKLRSMSAIECRLDGYVLLRDVLFLLYEDRKAIPLAEIKGRRVKTSETSDVSDINVSFCSHINEDEKRYRRERTRKKYRPFIPCVLMFNQFKYLNVSKNLYVTIFSYKVNNIRTTSLIDLWIVFEKIFSLKESTTTAIKGYNKLNEIR